MWTPGCQLPTPDINIKIKTLIAKIWFVNVFCVKYDPVL